MGVSQKTAAKIGLFGSISIIIGAMIGIGIFFKNGSVFANNDNNVAGILLSWIIAFIIAVATAYSYGEIVSCKTKTKNSGLAGWSEEFFGARAGRFVKINQPSYYYSIYVFVISLFTAEALWNCFMKTPGTIDTNSFHFVFIMLTALGLVAIFAALNFFSLKASASFSKYTTLVKFLPLFAIAGIGIVAGCINNGHNMFIGNPTINGGDPGSFNPEGILMSIPAILFAFDSFLIVGNIAGDMEKPEKNIPLSIILSMIIAGSVYLLVTIGQLCLGAGSAYDVFTAVFGKGTPGAQVCNILISIFILIAILGCLNALVMGSVRSMQSSIDEEVIVGSKKIKAISNGHKLLGGFIGVGVMYAIFWIALVIPSAILNTDALVDGLSNLVVVLYYGLYALVVLFALINRKTNKVQVKKVKGFTISATISVIGCFVAVGYLMFWAFSFKNISDANGAFKAWGLFAKADGAPYLMLWQATLSFWVFGLAFFGFPLLNDLLIKLTDKNYEQPLLWENQNSQAIKLRNI